MTAYRQIYTKMWSDAWFQDLLPEEKLLFIYTFSNDHAALCGMYEISLKTMGFETGLRPDAITLALHRFEEAGKVFYAAPWIWVPNLRKYNENRSPKVLAKIKAELEALPDIPLRELALAGGNEASTTHIYTVSGDSSKTRQEQEQYIPKHEQEPKTPRPSGRARKPDELFDAIAEVCQIDPATAGASIGKVKAKLLKADPPYTAEEVGLFKQWWWSGGYRKRPPRVWDIQEQIGVVRNGGRPQNEPKSFAAIRQAKAEMEARGGE